MPTFLDGYLKIGAITGFLSSVLPHRDQATEEDQQGVRRHRLGPEVMLVTCFGYTGYRNAKFGQIQIQEKITDTSRELLMQIKELAEKTGFEVLHGIVDCLWVIGETISKFKEAVERETGIFLAMLA